MVLHVPLQHIVYGRVGILTVDPLTGLHSGSTVVLQCGSTWGPWVEKNVDRRGTAHLPDEFLLFPKEGFRKVNPMALSRENTKIIYFYGNLTGLLNFKQK